MGAGANKALFRRFVEAWNAGDWAAMEAIWAPELVHHSRFGTHARGEVSALMQGFMGSFTDLRFDIEELVAEGDIVSARMRASFRHTGPFMGIEPSGAQMSVQVMGMVRVRDGQFVEHWSVMDELHFLGQLGLVPADSLHALA